MVLANDLDADNDPISAVLDVSPGNGVLTLNSDGSLVYSPNAGYVGLDAFTYHATDGVDDSNVTTVTIDVQSAGGGGGGSSNAAPVANDDTYGVNQDTTFSLAANGVLANDSDADGDSLNVVLVSPPTNGSLTLNADGAFDYTPDFGFSGLDTFTYRANDGTDDSNVATVTIDVSPGGSGGGGGHGTGGNEVPAAVGDSFTIDRDTKHIGSPGVLGNDADPDGDPLSAVLESGPSHGLLTFNTDGSFTYVPNAGFLGTDSFAYRASDGIDNSAPVTVALVVDPLFGVQTNQSDRPFAGPQPSGPFAVSLQTGDVFVSHHVGDGHGLLHRGVANTDPIIAVEATVAGTPGEPVAVPDTIAATLTFGGVSSPPVWYSGSSLMAGETARFVVRPQTSTLASGRYQWQLEVVSTYGGETSTSVYSGSQIVVNGIGDGGLGDGWSVADVDRLVPDPGNGVVFVSGNGPVGWFADNGDGTYASPDGPLTTHVLTSNSDGTLSLMDKVGNRSDFNSDGLLSARSDLNGNTSTYAYADSDADGTADDLISITDPFGRVTTFAYAAGLLAGVTDNAGRVTSISRDSAGRIAAITAPDPDDGGPDVAPVTGLTWDAGGRVATITDPAGSVTTLSYDVAGRLDQFTSPLGQTQQITALQSQGSIDPASGIGTQANPAALSQADDFEAMTIDPLGAQQAFDVDRFGFVTRHTNELGFDVLYERNPHGQVTKVTRPDPDGPGPLSAPVTTYAYDGSGNLASVTLPDGSVRTAVYDLALNRPTTVTDALGRTTSYVYDTAGNVTFMTDAAGRSITWTRNGQGQVTGVTLPDPDGSGPASAPVTSVVYDALGRETSVTNPDGTIRQRSYDVFDRVTTTTDELGRVTTYTYDKLNRPLLVTRPDPDGSGPLPAPTGSFSYDVLGRVVARTDAAGNTTSYTYDALGNVLSVTDPDPDDSGPLAAPVTTYAYDASGRLSTATDALGNETTYGYNAAGWLVGSITFPDPDGSGGNLQAPVVAGTYDNLGRRTSTTDPLGNTTHFAYDSLGRVTSTTDPLGGVHSVVYDAAGRVTSTADPLGHVTTYAWDTADNLLSVTQPDPDGGGPLSSPVTHYASDLLGRTTSVTDPTGAVTSFEYDVMGRRTAVTSPAGHSTTFAWDTVGNQTQVADSLNNVTVYAYDNLNRTISRTDANGGVTSFEYDGDGRLISLTDPVGNQTAWEYDGIGRTTKETNPAGDTRLFE